MDSARSVTQSCVTLCEPKDCSLPGSSIHGTSQARILECAAMLYSRGSFQPRDRTHASCTGRQILSHWATWEVPGWRCCAWSLRHVWLFMTPWLQPARLLCPWGFSKQEYWSGLPCPTPGDLPDSGVEPRSPTLKADSLLIELPRKLKNTGVGSLSLLQGIFPTQESNQDLLYYRWILYQLRYQGSPIGWTVVPFKFSLHAWRWRQWFMEPKLKDFKICYRSQLWHAPMPHSQ